MKHNSGKMASELVKQTTSNMVGSQALEYGFELTEEEMYLKLFGR